MTDQPTSPAAGQEPTEAQAPGDPAGRGPAAILGARAALPIEVTRRAAPPHLQYWIDYFWIVRWSLTTPHVQRVIPQPVIHVAAEDGRLSAHGVGDNDFSRTLRGTGLTVGIACRAGGFRGFIDAPMSALARTVTPVGDILGVDDRPIADRLLHPGLTDDALVDTFADWLIERDPVADPVIDDVADLVGAAEVDVEVTRVEQLAEQAGVSVRTLQRLFGDYVGIGPKWVIQRFRLLDVAAIANTGETIDWADTASRLGFTDQAHLTRAFTSIVGTPPATYVRQNRHPSSRPSPK